MQGLAQVKCPAAPPERQLRHRKQRFGSLSKFALSRADLSLLYYYYYYYCYYYYFKIIIIIIIIIIISITIPMITTWDRGGVAAWAVVRSV